MEEAAKMLEVCGATNIKVALDGLFRRLLANLMLDFNNPKFRRIRKENPSVSRFTKSLDPKWTDFLFRTLCFYEDKEDSNFFHFYGTYNDLLAADKTYSYLETSIRSDTQKDFEVTIRNIEQHRLSSRETVSSPLNPPTICNPPAVDKAEICSTFNPVDFDSVTHLHDIAKTTLLNTGRIRNCFFEARHFSLRRMTHGRVYACTDMCSNSCLEAHWHLFSGKGLLYSYVAHLSEDGLNLFHLGSEYGYQYNGIPGSENFGKTVCFSEKFVAENGTLKLNKHPNKPSETCIYCGTPFSQLFL